MYEFDRGLARMLREPVPKEWLMLSPNERAHEIDRCGMSTGPGRGEVCYEMVVVLERRFEAV